MNPEDIKDENIREKLDEMGIFAQKTVWEKVLKDAMQKKYKVQIYVSGNYKSTTGYIEKIEHGVVFIDTPVSKDVVVIKRIYWVQVFKPEAEESEK